MEKKFDIYDYEVGETVQTTAYCDTQIYYNEDTFFGSYSFFSGFNRFIVKGNVSEELIKKGSTYKITGVITEYKGDKQISLKTYYEVLPKTIDEMESYLINEDIDIRDVYNVLRLYKEDTFNLLMKHSKQINSKFINTQQRKIDKLQYKLNYINDIEKVYEELKALGVSIKNIRALVKLFGTETAEKIKENPYLLMRNLEEYSFKRCDKIAIEKLNFDADCEYRVQAGAIYALQHYQNFGHCYCPRILLIPMIRELLNINISIKEVEDVVNKMIKDFSLIEENSNIYLQEVYEGEINIANKIFSLTKYRPVYERKFVEEILDNICLSKGYELEPLQREACIEFNLYDKGIFILGGGAGTGKTFTLNLILEVQKEIRRIKMLGDKKVTLLAPTGKASKVVTQATGMPCSTIHRSIMFKDLTYANTIVCDESSMIDLFLADKFFNEVNNDVKIFFLGDTGQIPSIGAGNILNDLIESNLIKSVFLKVPKRQSKMSGIVKNANRVLNNCMIKSEPDTKDFYIMERKSVYHKQETVLESVRRILKFPGYTIDDVQVLIPQKVGDLGVNLFNYLLQKEFNKDNSGAKILKRTFKAKFNQSSTPVNINLYIKKNDRVMHIKNDNTRILFNKVGGKFVKIEGEKGIFNGEVGVVESVFYKKNSTQVIVKYDDYYVFYKDNIEDLELAYATTIHKSQGSAYRATVTLVASEHAMWSNNLLYTALTRAREFSAVVGELDVINNAIHNHTVVERFTTLNKRLMKRIC